LDAAKINWTLKAFGRRRAVKEGTREQFFEVIARASHVILLPLSL
jgi:hypothetical protein